MRHSILLQTSSNFICQIMLMIATLMLLRGHNHPGGGFVAALIACAAIALYVIAYEIRPEAMRHKSAMVIRLGLLCFVTSLFLPVLFKLPLLSAMWVKLAFRDYVYKLGTPLLFDIGVFCLIAGSVSWLITEFEAIADD